VFWTEACLCLDFFLSLIDGLLRYFSSKACPDFGSEDDKKPKAGLSRQAKPN